MPTNKIQYVTLNKLLKNNLSTEEHVETGALIKSLKSVRVRGWLLKDELVKICYWKSPRAIRHIESNNPKEIKKLTKLAFASRSEKIKIIELTKLKGVSIPMASSILMLTNPKRYGVIDIRIWQVMHKLGIMKTNPKGVNFRFKEWYRLLVILRYFSKKYKVSTRDVERTIFLFHQKYQEGLLYRVLVPVKK